MHEGLSNISTQIPLALARRLDARVDEERRDRPAVHPSRSSVIRAALAAYLVDTPDPKAATTEDEDEGEPVSGKPYFPGYVQTPKTHARKPKPSPVRQRTPRLPVSAL
jgi:hypothetical protein